MESFASQTRAFIYSLAIHVALILLVWFGVDWLLPPSDAAAAGAPVEATLRVSDAELQAAKKAIAKAEKKQEEAAPPKPPQPVPEPRPQTSPTPPQPKPQEQLDKPDTVDQEAISRAAIEPPKQPAPQEQVQRQRQEQAELTQDLAKQQEAERKQRLLAYEDVRKQREAAERRTKMEEQRLQQLADLQPAPAPPPRTGTSAPAPTGNRGQDTGLLARYKAAMLQTADHNWNHLGAPELSVCKVRFTQIPGGEVINVEFMSCPYDSEGREFVERALKKTPMPYSGFEPVFMRQVELSFCFPREDCER
jgi:colicin import membrane protein